MLCLERLLTARGLLEPERSVGVHKRAPRSL